MKLKYITFTLENCDQITIDGKYIGGFYVGDIKSEIHRIACNSIMKMDTTHEFAIEINKNADKEHFELGCENYKTTTFARLVNISDITSIEFELEEQYVEDGKIPKVEHYDYYVNWTVESDYTNDSQKSYISKPGHLYLVISKDKNIEDYFDKEEIDDEEMTDFYFDMCDVGDDKEYDNTVDAISSTTTPEEIIDLLGKETFEKLNNILKNKEILSKLLATLESE